MPAQAALRTDDRLRTLLREVPQPYPGRHPHRTGSGLGCRHRLYVRLPTSFCYLAAIIDDYSRYCVGWSLSKWIDTRLTLEALTMALQTRRPCEGLIHHSDQGVQYASADYVAALEAVGAQISMASVGNPYENAKAESFFRTLKMEEVYLKDYRTFEEAEENMGEFIEEVYNKKRLHSSLGYLPPVEFEATYVLQAGS